MSAKRPAIHLPAASRLAGEVVARASARSDVPAFIVMDVVAAAARLEAAGRRIIHMEIGQPAAAAPPSAIAAAQAALAAGRIGYTPALGNTSLRQRIARHYAERYCVEIDPQRVVLTTGSSAAFMLAFLSMFEPGDRIAIASPGYPPYRNVLTALGCQAVPIEVTATTRFALAPAALVAAHAERPLAGVLVASPANPTGTMMTPKALAALIRAAQAEGLAFISDEIYHGLDYAFPAQTALNISADAIVINSFSKYFCMTGWRIGWMVVPEPLIRPIERLQQNLAISVPALSQVAAEAAFDGRDDMEAVKHGYEVNRRILMDGLPRAGFDQFLPVDGAFYLYADVSRFCSDSSDFARRMLEEAGVAATPGADFDPLHGRRFIRLCYAGATPEVTEAVERLTAWLKRG
jgi:aspartate/methionine/tyrosine aminotransferase